jgi:DNA invertase Pin-like site-specific DNA recombinase
MRVKQSRVPQPKRAAIYVRMSTEHQDYSISHQTAALEQYAAEKDMVIVKRFIDPGRSGLTLSGRPALQKMLLDIVSNEADFEHVLVYDVSRWGRFLDTDESAYYEYSCKRANRKVHYCLEPFENDGSIYSTLIKNLKRIMAGEYSRELSAKVHAAQVRFAQLGFKPGGAPGYGLRRQVVDREGKPKGWLQLGDRKGNKTDRVKFGLGPQSETDIVRQIFRWFAEDKRTETQIASLLNAHEFGSKDCEPWTSRRKWTRFNVHEVLTNPKYIGTVRFNRTSGKLGSKPAPNPPDFWVCCEEAFEAIVEPALYEKTQQIIAARLAARDRLLTMSDGQILQNLDMLFKKRGRLSTEIIEQDESTPSPHEIRKRFRSLPAVYELVGYQPKRDSEGTAKRRKLRALSHGANSIAEAIYSAVASGTLAKTFTISDLKVACPGWAQDTYAVTCAQIVSRHRNFPITLERVGRGEYYLASSLPPRRARRTAMDECQILEQLIKLRKREGRLTSKVIAGDPNTPSVGAITRRFGSLTAVYELLGYTHHRDGKAAAKLAAERRKAREPGGLAEVLLNAHQSGKITEPFTIAALRASCPGWGHESYYSFTSESCKGLRPIKLLRVAHGQYRIATDQPTSFSTRAR